MKQRRSFSSSYQRGLRVEQLEQRSLLSASGLDVYDFDGHDHHQKSHEHDRMEVYRKSVSNQQRLELIRDFLHQQSQLQDLNSTYPTLRQSEVKDFAFVEPISPGRSLVYRVQPEPEFSIIVLGVLETSGSSQNDGGERTSISSPGSEPLPVFSENTPSLGDEAANTNPTENAVTVQDPTETAEASPETTAPPTLENEEFGNGPLREESQALDLVFSQLYEGETLSEIDASELLQKLSGSPMTWQASESENAIAAMFDLVDAKMLATSASGPSSRMAENIQFSQLEGLYDPIFSQPGLKQWLVDLEAVQQSLLQAAFDDMAHLSDGSALGWSSLTPSFVSLGENQIFIGSADDSSQDADNDWEVAGAIASNPALSSAGGVLVLATGMSIIHRNRQRKDMLIGRHERDRRERRNH